jgi:putative GTP pyrophosphokinase
MTIKSIQLDWEKNRNNYERYQKYLHKKLESIISDLGIQARVISRTKKIDSIIKKLYKKHGKAQFSDYLQLKDIVGVRIICRFRDDTYKVAEEIKLQFQPEFYEDKSNILKHDQVGYKSLHIDVKLKSENTPPTIFTVTKDLTAEIQIRTLCEDTWAEIYHDIGYKPLNQLPKEVDRQLHCLAGLLEIADDCFSNLNSQVGSVPELNEDTALLFLESFFIKYFNRRYDRELSHQNLKVLLSVHSFGTFSEYTTDLSAFIHENKKDIVRICKERKNQTRYLPYLSQPEIFLIFYLISNNLHALNATWNTRFNIEDLEELCILWAKPLVDYDSD